MPPYPTKLRRGPGTRFIACRIRSVLQLFALAMLLSGTAAIAQPLPALIPYRTAAGWGYSDSTGKIRIAPAFRHAGMFLNGKAMVALRNQDQETFCVIDTSGNFIIPPEYHWNGSTSWSLEDAAFNVHDSTGRYGIVDPDGRLRIPFRYSLPPGAGLAGYSRFIKRSNGPWFMIAHRDGKYGVIDTLHQEILPFEYDAVIPPETDSLFGWAVRKNDRWGLLRPDGSVLLPVNFDTVQPLFRSGLAIVRQAGKAGIIDTSGNWRTTPTLDWISNNGYDFMLCSSQSFGLADRSGRTIVPARFSYVERLEPNYLIAVTRHRHILESTLYDRSGNLLMPTRTGGFYSSGDSIFFSHYRPRARRVPVFRLDTQTLQLVRHNWHYISREPPTDLFPKEKETPWVCGSARRHRSTGDYPFLDSAGHKLHWLWKDSLRWAVEARIPKYNPGSDFNHIAISTDKHDRKLFAVIDEKRNYRIRPQSRFRIIGGVWLANWLIVRQDSSYAIADTNLRMLTALSVHKPSSYYRSGGKGYCISRAEPGEPSIPEGAIRIGFPKNEPLVRNCSRLYDSSGKPAPGFESLCFPELSDSNGLYRRNDANNVISITDSSGKRGFLTIGGKILYPKISFRNTYMQILAPGLVLTRDDSRLEISNHGGFHYQLLERNGAELIENLRVTQIAIAAHEWSIVPAWMGRVPEPSLMKMNYTENGTGAHVYLDRHGRIYADGDALRSK